MAVKGRQWSELERLTAEYFMQLREDADETPSYRRIGAGTGMTHSRVMDILRKKNGTPTLLEFVTLCHFFGKDAADVLRELEHETDDDRKEGDDHHDHDDGSDERDDGA
ncbi:hypothetical protein DSM100688_1681 [Bifidobacterium ramosum]|uniref:XRE family transcriptional regulator n=1 Tax=Bifidobacterium ramosum TaxID=1798158 RepID=A0A6L4WYG7_9BIFI|nr:hypothetical protein [Bifidobacterium ramosum]KAB8287322.1 hypothetical protein DSM100688_1681 [Bifidobacterium ramosum]NEG72408.1 hypothetical protein [Bifidobacterium ramosum]